MTRKFQVSEKLSLPRESVTWVNAFLAKRGAGKTYNAAVLAEEMLKNDVPIVVVDGMGIWWGLRVNQNKKSNGLPIIVFGGQHADIPLDPAKAKSIAKAVVETNNSIVLDISDFSKTQSRKIVQEFLEELYKLNRLERHVFIEEADLWAPQKTIYPEQAQCLGAVDNFVRRGGNHNLGCSLITQRSAVLNKDILTQADCLIILRTLAPQDKKAIQAWVEEQTDEDKKKLNKWYDSLNSLKNGEAWVWHPEEPKIFKKVQFRVRETFHATREFLLSPKAGKIKLMDVNEFIQKFKKHFEPKEQPKEIVKKSDLRQKPAPQIDENRMKSMVESASKRAYGDAEIAVKKAYSETERQHHEEFKKLQVALAAAENRLARISNILGSPAKAIDVPTYNWKKTELKLPEVKIQRHVFQMPPRPVSIPFSQRPVSTTSAPVEPDNGEIKLDKCARMIYTFLASSPEKAFSKSLTGAMTGYSHSSGGFNNSLGMLRKAGLIKKQGDMLQALEVREEFFDGEKWDISMWLQKLDKCSRELFKVISDNPDNEFTKEELGEQTGYASTSGGFNNSIGRLNGLGLITKQDGKIRLNEEVRGMI